MKRTQVLLAFLLGLFCSSACLGDYYGTDYAAAVRHSLDNEQTLLVIVGAKW